VRCCTRQHAGETRSGRPGLATRSSSSTAIRTTLLGMTILSLLASGVAVAGAGGWGAVLAADMHPYGMTGIGDVFAGLLDGSIADDEAACQGPGGRGDLRAFLALAAARGQIAHSDARRILDKAGPGSDRWTWTDLCRIADSSLLPSLQQFRAWLQRLAAIDDAARADARKALGLAAAGLLAAALPSADRSPAAPWSRPATGRTPRQVGTDRGRLPARLVLLALYHPGWPFRWHRYVLSRAGHAVGDLHPGELPDERIGRWLTPAETSLPAGERARRVLVRAAVLDPGSPAWPITRTDADALASGLTAPVPPFPPRAPRALARIWGIPEADLGVTALDRGFDSPASALRCASPRDA
jgi:TfuA-like protein